MSFLQQIDLIISVSAMAAVVERINDECRTRLGDAGLVVFNEVAETLLLHNATIDAAVDRLQREAVVDAFAPPVLVVVVTNSG